MLRKHAKSHKISFKDWSDSDSVDEDDNELGRRLKGVEEKVALSISAHFA